jgi:hypothetical protein
MHWRNAGSRLIQDGCMFVVFSARRRSCQCDRPRAGRGECKRGRQGRRTDMGTGDPLIAGKINNATNETVLDSNTVVPAAALHVKQIGDDAEAIRGEALGDGTGVVGTSANTIGVLGNGPVTGVFGVGGNGVFGYGLLTESYVVVLRSASTASGRRPSASRGRAARPGYSASPKSASA